MLLLNIWWPYGSHRKCKGKMGRLVGYYEQRRTGEGTPLDVLLENRNQHLWQKSMLIGCGGGYQQALQSSIRVDVLYA